MKFKVIDGERLSIYLTQAELEKQSIDADALKDPERLRCFLEQAEKESGFGVEDSALEIEIIPILDGDLLVSVKKIERTPTLHESHFAFYDTDSLIMACKLLEKVYFGRSDLYLYDRKYHLMLKSADTDMRADAILREFGTEMNNIKEAVLKEHGKVICEQNCIEMFTKTFFNR